MARTRRNEGGSILWFIVIVVALAAVFGIGLYSLRQRSEQAKSDETSIAANDENSDKAGDEAKPAPEDEGGQNGTEDETGTGGTGSTSGSGSTGGGETLPGPSSQSSQGSGSQGSQSGTTGSSTALPETGPTETVLSMLVLAGLTYGFTAYVASRRRLARERADSL